MGFRVRRDKKWPNGIIPYNFDWSLLPGKSENSEFVRCIESCMDKWESSVNPEGSFYIRFVRVKGDNVKIIQPVTDGDGGAGENGYEADLSKRQKMRINISRNKWDCIPHELGHVLGLAHEHERNPQLSVAKQSYSTGVTPRLCVDMSASGADIRWMAVQRAQAKYEAFGGYDVESIMHYPKVSCWDWSCEGENLVSALKRLGLHLNRPGAEQVVRGQWAPSAGDIATLRDLYGPQTGQTQATTP